MTFLTSTIDISSSPVCDLETDYKAKVTDATAYSGEGLVPNVDAAGKHNLGVINAALAAQGVTIFDPIYIPGKLYYSNPGIVIPVTCGGKIHTGGGLKYDLEDEQRGIQIAGVTEIVFTDTGRTPNLTDPCIYYRGSDWYIEPIAFYAWPIITHAQWVLARAGTAPYASANRRLIGMQIEKTVSGFANGRLKSAGIHFAGFVKGTYIASSPINDHCDKNDWAYYSFDYADYGIYCDNAQSIQNHIKRLIWGTPCTNALHFEAGDISFDECAQESFGKILYVGTCSPNSDWMALRGVRVDNNVITGSGTDFKVISLGGGLDHVKILMEGNVNANHASGGYVDDPIVEIIPRTDSSTAIWDGNGGKHYDIELKMTGISPAMKKLYSPEARQGDIASGLIGYWKLKTDGHATVGPDLTLVGVPTFPGGCPIGGGMSCNGTSQYAHAAIDCSRESKLTFTCWIAMLSMPGTQRVIAEYGDSSNSGFTTTVPDNIPDANSFRALQYDGASLFQDARYKYDFADFLSWNHFTFVFDRTKSTYQNLVFKNGEGVATEYHTNDNITALFANTTLNLLGRSGGTLYCPAIMAHARLYNRAFTAFDAKKSFTYYD